MTNLHLEDTSSEAWDIEITPNASAFHLNLGELWRYRDLIFLMVKRDFTARYKQTVLGPLWNFIQPILTTIVSFLVFNVIAKIATPGKNPVLFQMSGIIIWTYFAACLTSTANTFIANAGIFGKVYFPRLVAPISVIISNLVQLGIQLLLLAGTLLFFFFKNGETIAVNANWLLLPFIIIMIAGTGLGMGIMISSVTTKYRDFVVLIGFGVQLLMYGSAVNYPLSELEKNTHTGSLLVSLVKWNPISTLVEAFRNSLLGGEIRYWMLGYCAIFMMLVLLLGIMMFNRVEKTFMDTV
ncbi:MAG: ABC transporter permease [Bacteroidota bacterium]